MVRKKEKLGDPPHEGQPNASFTRIELKGELLQGLIWK